MEQEKGLDSDLQEQTHVKDMIFHPNRKNGYRTKGWMVPCPGSLSHVNQHISMNDSDTAMMPIMSSAMVLIRE